MDANNSLLWSWQGIAFLSFGVLTPALIYLIAAIAYRITGGSRYISLTAIWATFMTGLLMFPDWFQEFSHMALFKIIPVIYGILTLIALRHFANSREIYPDD